MNINRYIGNTGRVIHVRDTPEQSRRPGYGTHFSPSPQQASRRRSEDSQAHINRGKKPPSGSTAGGLNSEGIGGIVKSLFPKGTELGDILVLAVFLFLYIESKDTDFLIMLIVLAFSFFKDSQFISELPFLSGLSSLF